MRSSTSGDALIWGYLTTSKVGQGLTVDTEVSDPTPMGSSSSIIRQQHSLAHSVEAGGIIALHLTRRPASSLDTCSGQVELVGAIIRIDFDGPASLEAPNLPHQSEI